MTDVQSGLVSGTVQSTGPQAVQRGMPLATFVEILPELTREDLFSVQALVNQRLSLLPSMGFIPSRGGPRRGGGRGRGVGRGKPRPKSTARPSRRPCQTAYQQWKAAVVSSGQAPKTNDVLVLFTELERCHPGVAAVGFTRYRDMKEEAGLPFPSTPENFLEWLAQPENRTRVRGPRSPDPAGPGLTQVSDQVLDAVIEDMSSRRSPRPEGQDRVKTRSASRTAAQGTDGV